MRCEKCAEELQDVAKMCEINAEKVPKGWKWCRNDIEELRKVCGNDAKRFRTNAEEMQKKCRRDAKETMRRDTERYKKKMQN